jgi:Ca-activated chloride channel family protein
VILFNPYIFAATFLVLMLAIITLHMMYPRLYAFRYRHTLVSVIMRRFPVRRRRSSMAMKIAIAVLLSIAVAQPYIVTKEKIYIESKEISELRFNARPALVVILDTSGSMRGIKLETAKTVITEFFERLSPSIDVGFMDFADSIKQAIAPDNRSDVVKAVKEARAGGGTMYSYPLKAALSWLKPYRELNVSTSVVFISDGMPGDLMEYRSLLKDFKSLEIPIYTVFIGEESGGINEMKLMANTTGGEAYIAKTVDRLAELLNNALEKAAQSIQKVEVKTRITKTVDVYTPLSSIFLACAAMLYLVYRFTVYRFSGVTF